MCRSYQRAQSFSGRQFEIEALWKRDALYLTINNIFCCDAHGFSFFYFFVLSFLSRVSILTRDIDIANMSVCLSVCPSVTFRYQMKTAKHIVIVFSPCGSTIILVLPASNISSRNSNGVTPCGDAIYRWGIKISRFSTNKSLYLANDTRYRHSYYGRRIGNRAQAFE